MSVPTDELLTMRDLAQEVLKNVRQGLAATYVDFIPPYGRVKLDFAEDETTIYFKDNSRTIDIQKNFHDFAGAVFDALWDILEPKP